MPHHKKLYASMIIDLILALLIFAAILAVLYLGLWGFFTLGRMVLKALGIEG